MTLADWVYLDGSIMPAEEARVSAFDRGFLFAHAAYEVTAVFNGQFVDLDRHLERLDRTLTGLEIESPEIDLHAQHRDLRDRNGLTQGLIYVQVTAGAPGPRDYYGPDTLTPSIFMFATHKRLIGEQARDGIHAISQPDTRWARRDLKTTQLLSQTLAYRAARRAGAETAILHEDGVITEAASANLWMVTPAGHLVTRDLSTALLHGITRARLLDLLGDTALEIEERAFTLSDLKQAREAFTSSTGVVIAPVLSVDRVAIGTGRPGPVTRQVQAAYYRHLGADPSGLDWL